jgi:hypothetical protein
MQEKYETFLFFLGEAEEKKEIQIKDIFHTSPTACTKNLQARLPQGFLHWVFSGIQGKDKESKG